MDIFDSLKISSSALAAQQIRLNTISSNLANIETTRTPDGGLGGEDETGREGR